ncbi:MAG TPA: ATP synthase F1 subunit delta [Myxococcota bacterium]|nr:ATP synthase F1 subunit delta [Myxococcota bacterium]
MRSTAAARRYARALFALAQEGGAIEPVRAELRRIAAQLEETPELRTALFRPLHPIAERRAVLRGVAQLQSLSRDVQNFLLLLIDQRRIVDFEAIIAEYDRLADEAAGRLAAEVVAASPLRDDQRERLRRALSARVGSDVELAVKVDPALIGGAIAKVGGLVFDGSLRTQLAQLRDNLTRG